MARPRSSAITEKSRNAKCGLKIFGQLYMTVDSNRLIKASRFYVTKELLIHRAKWRHSNLWSQYGLHLEGQNNILYVVKRGRFVALFE